MAELFRIVQNILIFIPPVVLAVTLHEVAHGRAALFFGDPTAKQQGRLSLNPLQHVDPVGTLLVPGVLFVLGGFIFGWAKPVPVNPRRMRHPRRDMALVSLAGPGANVLMAVVWAYLLSASSRLPAGAPLIAELLPSMCLVGVTINVILAAFNMLPLPPLDGSRVLAALLPSGLARLFDRIEPYAIVIPLVIVAALMASGAFGQVIGYPLALLRGWFIATFAF